MSGDIASGGEHRILFAKNRGPWEAVRAETECKLRELIRARDIALCEQRARQVQGSFLLKEQQKALANGPDFVEKIAKFFGWASIQRPRQDDQDRLQTEAASTWHRNDNEVTSSQHGTAEATPTPCEDNTCRSSSSRLKRNESGQCAPLAHDDSLGVGGSGENRYVEPVNGQHDARNLGQINRNGRDRTGGFPEGGDHMETDLDAAPLIASILTTKAIDGATGSGAALYSPTCKQCLRLQRQLDNAVTDRILAEVELAAMCKILDPAVTSCGEELISSLPVTSEEGKMRYTSPGREENPSEVSAANAELAPIPIFSIEDGERGHCEGESLVSLSEKTQGTGRSDDSSQPQKQQLQQQQRRWRIKEEVPESQHRRSSYARPQARITTDDSELNALHEALLRLSTTAAKCDCLRFSGAQGVCSTAARLTDQDHSHLLHEEERRHKEGETDDLADALAATAKNSARQLEEQRRIRLLRLGAEADLWSARRKLKALLPTATLLSTPLEHGVFCTSAIQPNGNDVKRRRTGNCDEQARNTVINAEEGHDVVNGGRLAPRKRVGPTSQTGHTRTTVDVGISSSTSTKNTKYSTTATVSAAEIGERSVRKRFGNTGKNHLDSSAIEVNDRIGHGRAPPPVAGRRAAVGRWGDKPQGGRGPYNRRQRTTAPKSSLAQSRSIMAASTNGGEKTTFGRRGDGEKFGGNDGEKTNIAREGSSALQGCGEESGHGGGSTNNEEVAEEVAEDIKYHERDASDVHQVLREFEDNAVSAGVLSESNEGFINTNGDPRGVAENDSPCLKSSDQTGNGSRTTRPNQGRGDVLGTVNSERKGRVNVSSPRARLSGKKPTARGAAGDNSAEGGRRSPVRPRSSAKKTANHEHAPITSPKRTKVQRNSESNGENFSLSGTDVEASGDTFPVDVLRNTESTTMMQDDASADHEGDSNSAQESIDVLGKTGSRNNHRRTQDPLRGDKRQPPANADKPMSESDDPDVGAGPDCGPGKVSRETLDHRQSDVPLLSKGGGNAPRADCFTGDRPSNEEAKAITISTEPNGNKTDSDISKDILKPNHSRDNSAKSDDRNSSAAQNGKYNVSKKVDRTGVTRTVENPKVAPPVTTPAKTGRSSTPPSTKKGTKQTFAQRRSSPKTGAIKTSRMGVSAAAASMTEQATVEMERNTKGSAGVVKVPGRRGSLVPLKSCDNAAEIEALQADAHGGDSMPRQPGSEPWRRNRQQQCAAGAGQDEENTKEGGDKRSGSGYPNSEQPAVESFDDEAHRSITKIRIVDSLDDGERFAEKNNSTKAAEKSGDALVEIHAEKMFELSVDLFRENSCETPGDGCLGIPGQTRLEGHYDSCREDSDNFTEKKANECPFEGFSVQDRSEQRGIRREKMEVSTHDRTTAKAAVGHRRANGGVGANGDFQEELRMEVERLRMERAELEDTIANLNVAAAQLYLVEYSQMKAKCRRLQRIVLGSTSKPTDKAKRCGDECQELLHRLKLIGMNFFRRRVGGHSMGSSFFPDGLARTLTLLGRPKREQECQTEMTVQSGFEGLVQRMERTSTGVQVAGGIDAEDEPLMEQQVYALLGKLDLTLKSREDALSAYRREAEEGAREARSLLAAAASQHQREKEEGRDERNGAISGVPTGTRPLVGAREGPAGAPRPALHPCNLLFTAAAVLESIPLPQHPPRALKTNNDRSGSAYPHRSDSYTIRPTAPTATSRTTESATRQVGSSTDLKTEFGNSYHRHPHRRPRLLSPVEQSLLELADEIVTELEAEQRRSDASAERRRCCTEQYGHSARHSNKSDRAGMAPSQVPTAVLGRPPAGVPPLIWGMVVHLVGKLARAFKATVVARGFEREVADADLVAAVSLGRSPPGHQSTFRCGGGQQSGGGVNTRPSLEYRIAAAVQGERGNQQRFGRAGAENKAADRSAIRAGVGRDNTFSSEMAWGEGNYTHFRSDRPASATLVGTTDAGGQFARSTPPTPRSNDSAARYVARSVRYSHRVASASVNSRIAAVGGAATMRQPVKSSTMPQNFGCMTSPRTNSTSITSRRRECNIQPLIEYRGTNALSAAAATVALVEAAAFGSVRPSPLHTRRPRPTSASAEMRNMNASRIRSGDNRGVASSHVSSCDSATGSGRRNGSDRSGDDRNRLDFTSRAVVDEPYRRANGTAECTRPQSARRADEKVVGQFAAGFAGRNDGTLGVSGPRSGNCSKARPIGDDGASPHAETRWARDRTSSALSTESRPGAGGDGTITSPARPMETASSRSSTKTRPASAGSHVGGSTKSRTANEETGIGREGRVIDTRTWSSTVVQPGVFRCRPRNHVRFEEASGYPPTRAGEVPRFLAQKEEELKTTRALEQERAAALEGRLAYRPVCSTFDDIEGDRRPEERERGFRDLGLDPGGRRDGAKMGTAFTTGTFSEDDSFIDADSGSMQRRCEHDVDADPSVTNAGWGEENGFKFVEPGGYNVGGCRESVPCDDSSVYVSPGESAVRFLEGTSTVEDAARLLPNAGEQAFFEAWKPRGYGDDLSRYD